MKYKPIVEEYTHWGDFDIEYYGQDCQVCPFREIDKGEVCKEMFEKEYGKPCSTHRVVLVAVLDDVE